MTRTTWPHVESVMPWGRPGDLCPDATPWGGSVSFPLEQTRGLVRRSLRSPSWMDVASAMPHAHRGALVHPTGSGSPSLSMSKRRRPFHDASRALRKLVVDVRVSRHVGQTEAAHGSMMLSAPSPGPLRDDWSSSPPDQTSQRGEWSSRRYPDVRVVAEKNGQATVATDSSPRRSQVRAWGRSSEVAGS
jgi:hypothetical protein